MRVIKLYITCSEELELDKAVIGNLIRQLNAANKPNGIAIELTDADDSDIEEAVSSDMFVALFHKEADRVSFTGLQKASVAYKTSNKPKVYIYFKDLSEGEILEEELSQFKGHICNELGHFVNRYNNEDSIKFSIIMQVMQVKGVSPARVQDSKVIVGEEYVADISAIPFTSCNEKYRTLKNKITERSCNLPGLKQRFLNAPDDSEVEEEYFKLKGEIHKLSDELEEYENQLFNTALSLSRLAGEKYSERVANAIELFNQGKVSEADTILNIDEIKKDAEHELVLFKQGRSNIQSIIKEFRLKVDTSLSNFELCPELRISTAEKSFEDAIKLSEEINDDPQRLVDLLDEFGRFLTRYAKYEKALQIENQSLNICKNTFGEDYLDTSRIYNNIGLTYFKQGAYQKAIEYIEKAGQGFKKHYDHSNNVDMATYLSNIGCIYNEQGLYEKAIDYLQEALKIRINLFGENSLQTAAINTYLGCSYANINKYDKAIELLSKSLKVFESSVERKSLDTAQAYEVLCHSYMGLGEYEKALSNEQIALSIRKELVDDNHPAIATSYDRIGSAYCGLGKFEEALRYYKMALERRLLYLGEKHHYTAIAYHNIGYAYYNIGDIVPAIENTQKAISIYKDIAGGNIIHMLQSYKILVSEYQKINDNENKIITQFKVLSLCEMIYGKYSEETASVYDEIATSYFMQNELDKSLKYFRKSKKCYDEIGDKKLSQEIQKTICIVKNRQIKEDIN